ncbi:MAG: hypothetical protein WCK15_11785 [Pirellula sp.]
MFSSSFSLAEWVAATMEHDKSNSGYWSIGLYRGQSLDALSPYAEPQPIVTGEHFKSFNGSAVADPFAIRRPDGWYLFFELFLEGQSNAVIGASRSTNLVDWETLGIVHSQPHHLSYPFVFEHDGQIYMMPESKSVRRVDIFRAVDFPHKWEFEKTILHGRYMDCSMVQHAGRYWLFAGWRSYWLKLFYAPHPLGPWKRHWMPVARPYSRSSTRPGGRPIHVNGQLVRFAQDNTDYYGQQLRAWSVTRMNRLWYSEKPLSDRPILQGTGHGWNARCMHHIDPHVISANTNQQSKSEIVAFVDGCA